jgi:diacylglycerol kinase (ATP)
MKKFLKSFTYAFAGILYCIKNERNFRVHLCISAYVLFFSQFYSFSRAEYGILFTLIALVLSLEAVNTAIEAITNRISPEIHPLAKVAKDTAAGAVLAAAVLAVAVGITLFWQVPVLLHIFDVITGNVIYAALFVMSAAAAVWFCFGYGKR